MSVQKTIEQFIQDARKIHGDLYNYDKVVYIKSNIKIIIICSIHGEFEQTPANHINGQKCPKCAGRYKRSPQDFIEDAKQKHGNRYDYSLIDYTSRLSKITIICLIHGSFEQTPKDHLRGSGCPKCGKEVTKNAQRGTLQEFIKKAQEIHGNKYDYSKVEYFNARTKVCIICPIHGEFWQTPDGHCHSGCNDCGYVIATEKRKFSAEELEEFYKFFLGRNIKVDFSLYRNHKTKNPCICLICGHGKNGDWKARLHNLRSGKGCPMCAIQKSSQTQKLTLKQRQFYKDQFKNEAKIDVDFSNYTTARIPVPCICLICGYGKDGEWFVSHSNLKNGFGCPNCNKSYGEKVSRFTLETLFKTPFPSSRIKMTDKKYSALELDCYSESLKLAAEVQGIQHYKFIPNFFHLTEKSFNDLQLRDRIKKEWCKDHGILLIEIDNSKRHQIFENIVETVKFTLQAAGVKFEDIEITEEMYYRILKEKIENINLKSDK